MREYLSAVDIAGEVILLRSVYKGSFLLIEGQNDFLLFGKVIDASECEPIPCFGKEMVIKVLQLLRDETVSGVMGIVDRDFDRFLDDEMNDPDICKSDANDSEMLMYSMTAFERFLLEYGSSDKCQRARQQYGEDLRVPLSDQASWLGALRLLSHRESLGLNFDGMKFFFSENQPPVLNVDRMIVRILGRTTDQTTVLQRNVIVSKISEIRNNCEDRMHLCNGHDFSAVLSFALKKFLGSTNQFRGGDGIENIERVMRLCVDGSELLSSDLVKCIRKWEEGNRPFRVLKVADEC